MKHTITLALLILCGFTASGMTAAQTDGLPDVQNFTLEAKQSKDKQAPIMVLFMSDSCPYCEQVLREFLLPMRRDAEYDSKVILRQIQVGSSKKLIDFDGKTTTPNIFARAHKVWAVPTVVLFDSQGKVLTEIVGLLTVDFYQAYLDIAINESQAKIKAAAK